MKKLRLIYLLLLLGLNNIALNAQTTFASEEELKKQAAKLFDNEEFEEAYPLYTQLTSIYPKDPNYNYRIGVCMLYSIEDKELPVSYLEFASKKSEVDKEVFFYLAKAYHLNYRFDDAIKTYQAYKKAASGSKIEKLQVDHQIDMCKSGKKLLRNLTDLVVIDKKEMNRADFFRAYDVSDIGGKLLAKPDEDQFKTALDKKKKESSIIYLATNNNQIYFSSYGTDPERGKDIFIIRKLPNGEWSPSQTLGYPVNTEYDEDFPFLHPNGKVLYFCSKGHNSMGGYDIFKTTLNEETDTWSKPVNMDFPINTPDDDILYVTNVDEKEAYFASARASSTGKTAVYHIKSDRRAIDKAIVKGSLIKNRENQSSDFKITVKDMKDNAIIGIYNSKTDGGYFMSLPNGGKFLFTVESSAFTTQSEVVEIPTQSSFAPLKQEISYAPETDKLMVKNLFTPTNDEDDTGYLEVLSLIKEKSKMDVNVNEISDNPLADSGEKTENTTQQSVTSSADPKKTAALSNNDIIKIAYEDAKDAETEAKEAREQADIALNLANQKNESAQSKTDEAKKLMTEAETITDNTQKQVALTEAKAVSKEAEILNDATVAAFNLAKKLEKSAVTKQEEADLSLKYAKDLEAAVKAKNATDALTQLDDQKQKLETLSQEKTSADEIFSSLKIDSDNKQRELNKAIQTSADIKQEIADNITLIENVQADVDKTKNEQLKKGLLDQITELKQENIDKQKELEQNDLRVVRLEKEFNGIKNETELVNTIIDRSKTETNETAAASVEKIDKTKLEQQVNTIKTETPVTVAVNQNTNSQLPERLTPVAKVDSEVFVKVNQKYTDEVIAAEKIENVAEREKAKADVLQKWSAAIDTAVAKQKEDFLNATDPEVKTQLANSISDAQQLSKEKQTLANESRAKAETLKEQETALASDNKDTVANTITKDLTANLRPSTDSVDNTITKEPTNITAPTDSVVNTVNNVAAIKPIMIDTLAVVKLSEKYNDDLVAAEKIENVVERESVKAEVLKKWSEAIDIQVNKEKQDFLNATDPETKTLLANSISDAQKLSEEKQTQANESLAKVETYKQADALALNPVATTTVTDTINKNVPVASEKQFTYNAPSAREQATQANILNEQAKDLMTQSNELKVKAETLADVEDKNAAYTQIETLTKQAESKKIEAAGIIAVANKTEFTNNQVQLEQQAQANMNNTADDVSMAEMMKDEAKIYFDKAEKLRSEVTNSEASYAKTLALDEAYTNEMIALEKQRKASEIYKKYNKANLALNNTANPGALLTSTVKAPKDTLYLYSNPPLVKDSTTDNLQAKNNSVVTTPVAAKVNQPSGVTLTEKEVFERKPKPVYSVAKPIPVNEKLPEGLIFKVQIGAFRNPIPQDLFKGMTPITGETTPQGFTRYTAGIFVKYATADKVKDEIRSMGYKDAFVVAFLNGKRISTIEAVKMAGIDPSSIPSDPVANNTVSPQSTVIEAASAENVTAVTGLFYTVQVGVYSQPVAASKLFNVKPLYSETTPTGMIRYNTGVYDNVPRAIEAKEMAIDVGIADAFVTAYHNGKRVSMSEAVLLANQGAGAFATASNINALPVFSVVQVASSAPKPINSVINSQQPINNNQQLTTNQEQATTTLKTTIEQNNAMPVDSGIVFKVQIGAFKEEVPLAIANQFLQIANKGIKNYKDENGLTIYTVGVFKNYEDANKIKSEVITSGVVDAFIVAYRDGKKISVEEAKQLINK